jgi:glycosyltransferase involved in cell wall biosynthesis
MDYSSLRVIVIRQNWTGCTGLSAANALARLGVGVHSVVEGEFLPLAWQSIPMRIVGKLIRKPAVWEFNAALIRLAASFRPHLVLVVKGQWIYAESIRKLKGLGALCICYYPDVSMFAHGPYIPKAIPEYDWIFTTKSFGPRDLADIFSVKNCSYLPHGYDPDIHKPRSPDSAEEESQYACDLSFIGGWSADKEAVLTAIATALPDLSIKIWGSRWQNVTRDSILAPFIQHRDIYGPAYALGVGGSKINLALVHERVAGASSGDLITSRTFHIPACGGFMLHRRTPDLKELFEEDVDCAAFDDASEAVEQIKRYLGEERARSAIAENGRRRVESAHSWDHRVKTVLDRYSLMHPGKSEMNAVR